MVSRKMGSRCNTCEIQLSCFTCLILVLEIQGHCLLNPEGVALLEFRAAVESDPYGAFTNWNPNDCNPCMWSGVHCVDGKVQMLELNGLSLEGVLAPDLGKLTHLKILLLSQNQFSGAIPKEIGELTMLEILDLRNNSLSGTIPAEIGGLHSLKCLLLNDNKFEGSTSLQHWLNRKIGHCISRCCLKSLKNVESFTTPIKGTLIRYINMLPLFNTEEDPSYDNADDCCVNLSSSFEPHVQNLVSFVRRRLAEQSLNLVAIPASGAFVTDQIIALPSSRSSGSFPAVQTERHKQSPPPTASPTKSPSQPFHHNVSNPAQTVDSAGHSGNSWKYIVGFCSAIFAAFVAVAIFFVCRTRAVTTIGPWRTGISGQLQKAFVTGVPKLNRTELETACEEFSNIIESHESNTVYKGTLSSGVEISVVSTSINSLKQWSKRSEMTYRKKIDSLSRINHKNFVNLIGYCEENDPFVRMMVFEYAPNGTLFEHLHIKELEHLDWNARMRIIMGTAYCLQYMHDLNPPMSHSNLKSNAIFLTDDYAAKIAEIGFWNEFSYKSKGSVENESEHSELPPLADIETNVYSFGVLLLEIISGRLPYSEEQGPLVNWASEYLNDKRKFNYMIDPTLKSFKHDELDIICEVVQECIQQDARKRPTVKEIIAKLREVIDVPPEAAVPRLSPLWWAELEILSAEAA